ncbi:MAG: multiheme c-type cytochrome [Opitutales bacterium]
MKSHKSLNYAVFFTLSLLLSLAAIQGQDLLDDGESDLLGGGSAEGNDDLLGGSASSEDDLLGGGGGDDDLLGGSGAAGEDLLSLGGTEEPEDEEAEKTLQEQANEAHQAIFAEDRFPSASTCAQCHPGHYREWAVSPHAYAQLSPVFNAMHAKIVKLTSGTNGDFCIRCHSQVGMQLGEPVFMSNLDRHPASREGITCIVCHRVDASYGKVSGRFFLVEGSIFEPVFGPKGNEILEEVLAQPSKYPVNTDPEKAGRNIHTAAIKHNQLAESGFCGACHDVNLLNGFRLEEAFSQFKNTESNARGESCQDCHMATIPGVASEYAVAPSAMIGDEPTTPRKRTNHMFAGPDYSIVHPGIFPHNVRAQELATMRQWLTFDFEAGWGTDHFENNVPEGYEFPERWKYIDDRYDARAILDDQFALLEEIRVQRYQILRRGIQLEEVIVTDLDDDSLAFKIRVRNGTDGHGVPTGFDAERLFWMKVEVTDADGNLVFVSGDRDPNGDVRDLHSLYVHNWELPLDKQLFTLQSKFITRNLRGGEREQVLAVNLSPDPLPFIRPEGRPTILTGRPSGARKQSRMLPPSGFRWADYKVPSENLTGRPPYSVNVQFLAQMVPINLIAEIQDVGFDYGMSPRLIADRIKEQAHVLWDFDIPLTREGEIANLSPTEEQIMAPPPYPLELLPEFEREQLAQQKQASEEVEAVAESAPKANEALQYNYPR